MYLTHVIFICIIYQPTSTATVGRHSPDLSAFNNDKIGSLHVSLCSLQIFFSTKNQEYEGKTWL